LFRVDARRARPDHGADLRRQLDPLRRRAEIGHGVLDPVLGAHDNGRVTVGQPHLDDVGHRDVVGLGRSDRCDRQQRDGRESDRGFLPPLAVPREAHLERRHIPGDPSGATAPMR
jgi:hypothetical protein